MSHEIIAIKRPIRSKQPIEQDVPTETLPKQADSKLKRPTQPRNRPLSKAEGTDQPRKLERPRKPEKPKLKESIKQANNANGEVFNSGDKILISAPWSSMVEAEITGFYKSPEGSIWATFIPQTSLPNWNWEKGCIRAELLKQP